MLQGELTEYIELIEKMKAEGTDMVGLSLSFQIRGRVYKLLAKYLTDNDGELHDIVPDYLGMGSIYMAIDEIEQLAEDFLKVSKICLNM